MSFLDEISPRYYGSDRIRLTLADPDQPLQVFTPIRLAVDVSRCLPYGVVLPLEFTVTPPSGAAELRKLYRRFAPSTLVFTPREGGSTLIRLAELDHDRFWGALVLEITGDRLRG